ncbi:MAG: RluA family pseudouridine synthase [Ardenticatenaceae bacterium]
MRLTVPATTKNKHLLYWLTSKLPHLSASYAQRLLKTGAITVNGVLAEGDQEQYELAGGEVVEIEWSKAFVIEPFELALDVLYEDQKVVVINKPARIVVHPSAGHRHRTVINALLARYPESRPYSSGWPRLVHRLDRDTSGVLVAARTLTASRFLQKQFRQRRTKKEYLALVFGHPESIRGTIKGPIGPQGSSRKQGVVPDGRPATTHYQVLECFANHTLLLVRPITGRTHQIRVHLKAIALPVANDLLYGHRKNDIPQLKRQFLHAARLSITTPDRQRRTFSAPLPEELEAVLRELRKQSESLPFPLKIKPIHKRFSFYLQVKPIQQTPSFDSKSESDVARIQQTPSFDSKSESDSESDVARIEQIPSFESESDSDSDSKTIEKEKEAIELLSFFEDAGIEQIELTEGFEGFEEFFDKFQEFEDAELEELEELEEMQEMQEMQDKSFTEFILEDRRTVPEPSLRAG